VPFADHSVDTIAFKAYILRCFFTDQIATQPRGASRQKGIQCEITTLARS
jgi:hypothetical protein